MSTVIQIKRNLGSTAVAVPTLLDGELAYAASGFLPNGGKDELVIGNTGSGKVLISNQRQVELTGNQTIASGTKNFAAGAKLAVAVADLLVSGGAAGDTIVTDGAGNLTWGAAAAGVTGDGTTIIDNGDGTLSVAPGYASELADGTTIIVDANGNLQVNKAVTADVEAGTADKFIDTALMKADILGGGLSTLTTNAKLIVPAINELQTAITMASGGIIFAGTLDASTGVISPASGVANVPANIADVDPALTKNYFWIVTTPGSEVGPGNTVAANKQDWVASDGTKVVTLNYGMANVAAANVSYDGTGNTIVTGPTVQDALDQVEVALLAPIDGGTF
jgi:hypothetical protein